MNNVAEKINVPETIFFFADYPILPYQNVLPLN